MVRCRLTRGAQPLRHRLRDATSPTEGRPWHSAKLCLLARGSPTRGAVERSETERLDEGQPDREALAKLNLSVTPAACHLPYRGEALAFRKALPPRQRLPYQGQRRRPPPAAETGSRCWGRGQQDASDSAADAGCRNPALANEVRLRGWTKDSLTGKLLLDSTSPSRLTPCHLPYRGEALAFRKALPPRQRLPY